MNKYGSRTNHFFRSDEKLFIKHIIQSKFLFQRIDPGCFVNGDQFNTGHFCKIAHMPGRELLTVTGMMRATGCYP